MTSFNFQITPGGKISQCFHNCGITDFKDAAAYIRQLSYGRNTDKHDLAGVFKEQKGTCSTKHAVLWELARENGYDNVKLILGIVKMSCENTPAVCETLSKAKLDYIPEAHTYLKVDDKVLDYTKSSFDAGGPDKNDILLEAAIEPYQITDFKVSHHKAYLQGWLDENKHIPYSLDELFTIREQCIKDLEA